MDNGAGRFPGRYLAQNPHGLPPMVPGDTVGRSKTGYLHPVLCQQRSRLGIAVFSADYPDSALPARRALATELRRRLLQIVQQLHPWNLELFDDGPAVNNP